MMYVPSFLRIVINNPRLSIHLTETKLIILRYIQCPHLYSELIFLNHQRNAGIVKKIDSV